MADFEKLYPFSDPASLDTINGIEAALPGPKTDETSAKLVFLAHRYAKTEAKRLPDTPANRALALTITFRALSNVMSTRGRGNFVPAALGELEYGQTDGEDNPNGLEASLWADRDMVIDAILKNFTDESLLYFTTPSDMTFLTRLDEQPEDAEVDEDEQIQVIEASTIEEFAFELSQRSTEIMTRYNQQSSSARNSIMWTSSDARKFLRQRGPQIKKTYRALMSEIEDNGFNTAEWFIESSGVDDKEMAKLYDVYKHEVMKETLRRIEDSDTVEQISEAINFMHDRIEYNDLPRHTSATNDRLLMAALGFAAGGDYLSALACAELMPDDASRAEALLVVDNEVVVKAIAMAESGSIAEAMAFVHKNASHNYAGQINQLIGAAGSTE